MTELYKAIYTLYEVIGDDTDDIATYQTRDDAAQPRRPNLERNPSLKNRDNLKIRVGYQFKTSDGKIVLMGEKLDAPGAIIVKMFDTLDDAINYADNN